VAAHIVPIHREGALIKGAKLDGFGAQAVPDGFSRPLRYVPEIAAWTLDCDQGSGMALHKVLAKKLRMDSFFCDP